MFKKIKSARVIAIVSGKGGTGKTTSTVNLAASLNLLGFDVIAIDANITTPHLSLHLGAPVVPVTLHHVLNKKNNIKEAVYEHHSGIRIVPGSIALKDLQGLKINSDDFVKAVNSLRKTADFILIDSAPGLGNEAMTALKAADDVVVVTNPDMFSMTDSMKVIRIAKNMGKNVKGMIISRANLDKKEMEVSNVKMLAEVPILGVIPEDSSIRESLMLRDSLLHTDPGNKIAHSYMNLAKKILGVPRR